VGQPPQGSLQDGSTITNGSTTAYPDIEEVFGVLSGILNGGGLEKLQTINIELVKAFGGREARVRDFLKQLDILLGGLDKQKGQLVRAIDALDRLSVTLARQRTTIDVALRDLHPGIQILEQNRANLTRMLQSLSRLGDISSRVIRASKDATVKDLRALEPVLGQLAAAGQSLPRSLELLLDYPFPRNVTKGILGDYTNLYATLDVTSVCNLVQVPGLCPVNGLPQPPTSSGQSAPNQSGPTVQLPVPTPTLPTLPVPTPSLGGLSTLLGGAL
jgi:phospholipid/cholesterol/gamma-HCH transport system substrate-binding protein